MKLKVIQREYFGDRKQDNRKVSIKVLCYNERVIKFW